MLRIPSPGEPVLNYATSPPMTPTVQHTWQLECWGHGWAWEGCEGASEGWGNVSLVPLKQRAVEVTWVWPEWSGGEVVAPPMPPSDTDLRYQVEYGPLDAPFMLGRVGGSSRGVTLEEGVEPFTTYEVKLTTDAMANTSAIFFQIVEMVTATGSGKVRAEEILLVVLVLVLWAVAILLFFHRWGKIRMLEPYQPEYKALSHSPACPLAPTTPPQTLTRPPKPFLPRKSSSLCFTPSMLRTVQVAPPACRISVPHIDQTPVHRCFRAAHQSPAFHAHLARHRLRLASDSLDQSSSGASQAQVEMSRKVRSAENLRHSHSRIATTYCRGYSEESAVHGVQPGLSDGLGVHHHPLARRRSCQSQSLDLEHYRSPTPGLQEAGLRDRSLDSTSVSSLRRSPTAGPSSAGAEAVCTTPELRVSPTPPDIAAHHPHTHIVLQRQETIIDDTTLFQVPYATLLEEELENDA